MNSRIAFIVICAASVLISCGNKGYDPHEWLSAKQQEEEMWRVIRYIGRAPDNTTMPERFYKGYDEHYQGQINAHRLDAYFVKDSVHYFLISRIAPSNTVKRVATGGSYVLDDKGDMTRYEEVFRTWKAPDTTQIRKSIFLFDKMVKGENLEPYYTKNSWPNEMIEFPDNYTYYDAGTREWKKKPGDF
jgi:hypothetical protein